MKAHNIIQEFSPSGMWETNIYREIKEDPKANKFQGYIKDYFKIQLGGEDPQLSR
jgi:hypothetical protein